MGNFCILHRTDLTIILLVSLTKPFYIKHNIMKLVELTKKITYHHIVFDYEFMESDFFFKLVIFLRYSITHDVEKSQVEK